MSSTYSFLNTFCAITGPGGSFSIKDGVSEEGITFTPRGEKSTMTMGADGSWIISLHADKSADVSISVLKNSATNTRLSAMYNFQQNSSATWGMNVITLSTTGGDNITMTGVSFKKLPTIAYGKEAQLQVWEMMAGEVNEILTDIT